MKITSQIRTQRSQKVQIMMKEVNSLINQVFRMPINSIQRHIGLDSTIVSQLLHNDLISHIRSLPSLKLITLQLIIKLAQQTQNINNDINIQGQFSLNNKPYEYNDSIKKILYSVKQLLEEISWYYPQRLKTKSKTQKLIDNQQPSNRIINYQKQLNRLIQQYQISLKQSQEENKFDQEGQNALIQQLQEVIMKKQQKIRQLTDQLEQALIQHKNMENIIQDYQLDKQDIHQQFNLLKQQLEKLQEENKQYKQLKHLQTSSNLKENYNNRQLNHKNINHILSSDQNNLFSQSLIDSNQFNKKLNTMPYSIDNNNQDFIKLLLIQSLSIQALIN